MLSQDLTLLIAAEDPVVACTATATTEYRPSGEEEYPDTRR